MSTGLQMKIIEENWKVVEPYLKVLQNDPTVNPSTSSFSQLTQAEQKYVHETFFELREELRSKGTKLGDWPLLYIRHIYLSVKRNSVLALIIYFHFL